MKFTKWLLAFALAFTVLLGGFIPASTAQAATPDYQVEINKKTNKLYLYQDGRVTKTYPVATGRTKDLTPEGTFTMVVKIVSPGWKGIPGGVPENPLGKRWMGFSVNGDSGRTYGVHGTNQPASIGTNASSGCVRMGEANLLELYKLIPEGTPIWIHSGKYTKKWRGDSSYAVQPSSGQVKVKGNKVNIRTGPSTGSFTMEQVSNGLVLENIGYIKDWYQVRLQSGKVGFINSSFATKLEDPKPSSNFTDATGKVVAIENIVNVRSNPSLSASVIQRVSKGTTMTLTGVSNEWYRIKTSSGTTAYVHKSVAKKG
ncbi:L,D-transpeptidase family protein [Thermoactinomyces sp. DSM 45892]|uniref:L,D-transpeptidase family protein n=1 Tax=Thermoactinomyces sp. DSM 45892 TaxID=1882753 RepID=UPI000895AA53|nr:L,D-transpeptidase family protein [Thermoactinomyces sp. DSM 45892]SDY25756.1 SH3 domain-containing protein [Thermoactinomyces sp. DSM 45892]